MKLRDLEARFIQYRVEKVPADQWIDGVLHTNGERVTLPWVDTLEQAHGVWFKCPKCKGTDNPHAVICWFEGRVPDEARPSPGRWTPSGTGLDDLTFVPGKQVQAVSVQLNGGCGWHGFVKNGDAA